MALLRLSAPQFYERSRTEALTDDLSERYREAFLRPPPTREQQAWRNSLRALADVLRDADLRGVEVLVEHQLPLTSLRADVLLAGRHPTSGKPSYVVIELKQWSDARLVPDSDDLCLVSRTKNRIHLHPLSQVARYCEYLSDFTAVLDGDEESVAGFAYLHQAENRDVAELFRMSAGQHRQVFTNTTRGAFIRELRLRLGPESGALAADRLLDSSLAPNRPLLRTAADAVESNRRFVLLDEQQVAVSLVQRTARLAHRANQKEIIIVSGGPGSGKSVIALHLLRELARDGRSVLHATGSKSFTTTLHHHLGEGKPRVKSVFKYFNSFTSAEPNGLDVLICDEAHRIRRVSSNARHRPQVAELLDAARTVVFLLDDHQVVRPNEMGSVETIRTAAKERGMVPRRIFLRDQYRSGGSEAYDAWVLRLLELESGGPVRWVGDEHFHLSVADSPEEMERLLRQRQGPDTTARMTAGFCWPWSDPTSDGRLVHDVRIDGWSRPWNLRRDSPVGGAPASALWATDPAGFGQIGCIYTAQGFEYDWNGVIFGPDLVWRGDQWRANPAASRDGSLSRIEQAVFDVLVRNTYKVLLTRGMVGTVVYSTDPETQAKLRELIPSGQPH
ncbi:DNA/RNA helicase domain-containing protein [Streptomyces xiamenensis]